MFVVALTIACLLSVTCGQQLCSAVNTAVCDAGASQRQCYTSPLGFVTIGTSTWAYISLVVTNPGRISGGFAVSDQSVTINGQSYTLPNAVVTVSGTGSASVSYSSGLFSNTVGTNCADIFVTGLAIKPPSTIPGNATFQWCALFESQTSQANSITWNIGVAAYTDMGTGALGSLGILPSSNCSTNPDGYPAGTPVTYQTPAGNLVLGGTAPTATQEVPSGPTGLRTPDSTALVCHCPLTNAPTQAPTKAPTKAPTTAPTAAPSKAPTVAPTAAPTVAPTVAPTKAPTTAPTPGPTAAPTTAPTKAPTNAPTTAPTKAPTSAPTNAPTSAPTPPTQNPTVAPTKAPTTAPTKAPTNAPTVAPTKAPTSAPTRVPTTAPTPPTSQPTVAPTKAPTPAPTKAPTKAPTAAPTKAPTTAPTRAPTTAPTPPTSQPTVAPTKAPTPGPTRAPTAGPTRAPTTAPTPPTANPTVAPTKAPTPAPTKAPTNAPTVAPTKAPTSAPTGGPTNAPTPPTFAPTKAPTNAPTTAPTKAPTNAPTAAPTKAPTTAPTKAPTNAPTTAPTKAPTSAPTSGPTNAPTPPTDAPTSAPTNAPTTAPTKAPTNAPTAAPTNAPTPPTDAPTTAPTRAPTTAPTRAPTQAPTTAPSRAPTEAPTAAPTPPTVRPTRAPTVPTNAPVTKAPTTEAPTAPVDRCTRIFTAHFTLTYDAMTNGYVNGIMVYDYYQKVLAFYYTNQTYQEIYTFNSRYGVGDLTGQSVYRISANGTCSPCARYQNNWAFPVLWNLTGVDNPYPTTTDANGCTNYTTPSTNNNWASYYGIKSDGTLCYIGNQGRLFTLDSIKYCDTYNPQYTTPPEGCACVTPQDIVFSLDRSTSILTKDTYVYRQFISQFVDAYTFDPTAPATSMQLAITQWGSVSDPTTGTFPIGRFGSIPFTMDPFNIDAAISNIGCVGTPPADTPCNFCNGNDNASLCVFPTSFQTCTSCGLYSAATRFLDTANFRKRNAATQVIIVITDGNTNTLNASWGGGGQLCCGDGDPGTNALVPGVTPNCDDGNWNAYPPLGCYTDVQAVRQQVQGLVPGVQIFAIGIGASVKLDTLNVIATSSANVFAAPDWVTFLSQLQSIVTLTCVEPDPIKSCGTGSAACGFCNCGTTLLPDGIIYPNRCDSVAVVVQGQCFSTVPTTLNCTAPSCMVARCIPSLNNGTGDCVYDPRECNVVDSCYKPGCVNNACIPKLVCDANVSACNCTPTVPTNETDPCLNTTGGVGCGANGICDTNTLRCNCTNNYTGIVCQFPPGTSECQVDAECDNSDACSTFRCDNTTGEVNKCVYTQISCDDNNACSEDSCDFRTGCQHIFKSCNDNDGCTDDTCDNVTGTCNNTDRTPLCNYLIDVCTNAYCDPTAPEEDQCLPSSVLCPRENNCSLVFCTLNDTVNGIENYSGCYNRTLDCAGGFFGIIAGIAGGVIAGIVVAAGLVAAAFASGASYAVSTNYGHNDAGSVRQNPLFKAPGKGADVNLGA